MSEWISVKDRYPAHKQNIRIKVEDTEAKEHELECTFNDYEDYIGWEIKPPENVTIYAKPTHWMPLPDKEKHWSKTEDGKKSLLNFVNEEFFFLEDGKALRRDEYCSKCKNEWVACVCMSEFGKTVIISEQVVLKCCGKSAFDCECDNDKV